MSVEAIKMSRRARRVWTVEEVRALGVRTDLATAAAAVLGIGKTKAWEAYHAGQLPFPTIRCGHRVVVPVAPLLELLRLTPETSEAEPASPATATNDSRGAATNGRIVPAGQRAG